MKILVFQDSNGFIEPECINAFRLLGHELKTIILERNPDDHDRTLPYNIVERVGEILSFMPDLMLMVNGNGIDEKDLIPRIAAILKIPLAIWYVDRPYTLENWSHDHITPTTVIFVTDRVYVSELRYAGFDRVHFLPLATNPERFSKEDNIHVDAPMDIVFVGKLERDKANAYFDSLINKWHDRPDDFDTLFRKALHTYSKRVGLSLCEITHRIAAEHNIKLEFPSVEIEKLFFNSIEYMANIYYRTEVVRALRHLGITVCGGWEWLDVVDKGHYIEETDYFTGLAAIYKHAVINLNITRPQIKTGINQRLFDVPAAGGFLITDYRDDVEKFFEPGKEIVCYKNIDELKGYIKYYLAHPAERAEIVCAAREKVVQNHTYEVRMQEFISHITASISDTEYSKEINRVIRTDYLYIEALNLLGAAAWETGNSHLALEFFKLAVSLNPYNADAKRGIEVINRVISMSKRALA